MAREESETELEVLLQVLEAAALSVAQVMVLPTVVLVSEKAV